MTTHEMITDIVRAYYKAGKDSRDVDGLMDLRRRLAVLKYGMAAEVGHLYEEKNGAEFRRKAAFAARRAQLMETAGSVAKAEAQAQSEIAELMKDESLTDAAHRAANLILESAKDVMDVMGQHIANLRQEKRDEMTGQGSQ